MRKFFLCICLIFCLTIPTFATSPESEVLQIINDVQEIVPTNDTEINVASIEPVNLTNDITETQPSSNGAELALLNEIATVLNETQAESLFNINSSQIEYFKGILLQNPFYDYCVTFDGEQTYRLYYGHDLAVGDSANMASITRTNTGTGYNYYYSVVTGSTGTVPSGNVYVSTITEGMPIFEEVENAKSFKTLQIACIVALALWLLGKLFFR